MTPGTALSVLRSRFIAQRAEDRCETQLGFAQLSTTAYGFELEARHRETPCLTHCSRTKRATPTTFSDSSQVYVFNSATPKANSTTSACSDVRVRITSAVRMRLAITGPLREAAPCERLGETPSPTAHAGASQRSRHSQEKRRHHAREHGQSKKRGAQDR